MIQSIPNEIQNVNGLDLCFIACPKNIALDDMHVAIIYIAEGFAF